MATVLQSPPVLGDLFGRVGQVAHGGAGQFADPADELDPPGRLQDTLAAVAEARQPVDGGIVHVEGRCAARGQGPQSGLLLVDTGETLLDPGNFGGEAVDLGLGLQVSGRGVLDGALEVGPPGRVRIRTFSGQGRGSRGGEAGEQNQPGSEES